jgi:chitin-binding protein
MKIIQLCSISFSISALLFSNLAWSHGYVDYPKARQQICKDDGGYWWPADGSGIANLACRSAYQKSGGYALTQHHEYSTNVPDYGNMTAVKAGIKNGLLCAGGDQRKAGMDLPSPHWQSTIIDVKTTPTLKVRFRATTPHNPSFWQFYLSNPDYDGATTALSWDKLTLIHQQNDVPAQSGYYEIDVPMPKSRSGKAVLYTRWQRQDVVGEGFYNCSDLQLINGDAVPAQWYDKGAYLTAAQLGKVGEKALLRLFDAQGQEQIQHSLDINAGNVVNQAWALELANQINTLHGTILQIGVLQNGNVVLQNTPTANRLYVRDASVFVNLDLKPASGANTCGGLDPTKIFAWPNWPRMDHTGQPSYATNNDLMSDSGKVYRAKWWTQAKPGSDGSWDLVCNLPQ